MSANVPSLPLSRPNSQRSSRLAERAAARRPSSRPATGQTNQRRSEPPSRSGGHASKPSTPKHPPKRSTGYFEPGVAPLQGNPNPWRLTGLPKVDLGDEAGRLPLGKDGKVIKGAPRIKIDGDQVSIYKPPAGTKMPDKAPKYSTSIQSYPGVNVKEVGVVIPVAQDKNRKMVRCFDPLTHNTTFKPSLATGKEGPPREMFEKKVFFGRVKGYFGGFVDDVLKGANQQDDVEGAVTWSSSYKNQVTPSGMPKPFHPVTGPMSYYMDATLKAGHKNPFVSQ